MTKQVKFNIFLWCFAILCLLCFIGVLSFWYPVALDEFFSDGSSGFNLQLFKNSYLTITSRVSVFISILLGGSKWSFVFANPFVLLGIVLSIFYVLFLRFPDIKTLKDMPWFISICILSIFFVTQPDQVFFWLSGAINYSWLILFFLIMLCYLRGIWHGKFLKETWYIKILMILFGIVLGMTNENLSPFCFALAIGFSIWCDIKKVKTPKTLSFLIIGIALGFLIFFSSPSHYIKMSLGQLQNISSQPLTKRLFFQIFHINVLIKVMFLLPVITGLGLLIAGLDREKTPFKTENYLLSLFSFLIAFGMAIILFLAPLAPLRAYYCSSVMVIVSFLFLCKYLIICYKFDFSKILCYILVIFCAVLLPRFVLPYYYLHTQEQERFERKMATKPFIVLAGPTKNLSISFLDPYNRRVLSDRGEYVSYTVDETTPTPW